MDIIATINFITVLLSFVLALALLAGVLYGLRFLFGLQRLSPAYSRGGGQAIWELLAIFASFNFLVQFPVFVQDTVLTFTGISSIPTSPLAWGNVSGLDPTTSVATLINRFFQFFGVCCLYGAATSMAQLGSQGGNQQVTVGGVAARFIAGVFCLVPGETAINVGKLFPLIGEFGKWLSEHGQ
ncbi:hypothetical protein ACK32R_04345 [Aeromonas dhakensis]|jgi:hypothetical protein|uniref:hypothetical protein n=1 Tax=Aeromonas dhakensis TaxID=196024 RepID=UPI003987B0F4